MISLLSQLIELRATKFPNGALFLDRDGVLNIDKGYVFRWKDFDWVTGAVEVIRSFNQAGWPVIVVTNQSGVARGFYEEADVDTLHEAVNEYLKACGAHIDAFYTCPFHKDGAIDRYRVDEHPDRKPNPGMLLRAAAEHDVMLENSLLIGDKDTDIEAAGRVSARGFLFRESDLMSFVRAEIQRLQLLS